MSKERAYGIELLKAIEIYKHRTKLPNKEPLTNDWFLNFLYLWFNSMFFDYNLEAHQNNEKTSNNWTDNN